MFWSFPSKLQMQNQWFFPTQKLLIDSTYPISELFPIYFQSIRRSSVSFLFWILVKEFLNFLDPTVIKRRLKWHQRQLKGKDIIRLDLEREENVDKKNKERGGWTVHRDCIFGPRLSDRSFDTIYIHRPSNNQMLARLLLLASLLMTTATGTVLVTGSLRFSWTADHGLSHHNQ